jgi:hypothetical protein
VQVVPGFAQGFFMLASASDFLARTGDKRELRQTLIT